MEAKLLHIRSKRTFVQITDYTSKCFKRQKRFLENIYGEDFLSSVSLLTVSAGFFWVPLMILLVKRWHKRVNFES